MEPIFFILIGAALFSQSWYVLGLFSEGRTMGVFVGGLGLLSLAALTLTPMLLTGGDRGMEARLLAETTVMKTLIGVWAVYAIGVGAHGLWDFEDRAIGFYSAFLAVATLVTFIYFAVELPDVYKSEGPWLSLSGATLLLTVLAGMMFFALSFGFNVLRVVAGWFLLFGGAAVVAIGLLIMSTVIT